MNWHFQYLLSELEAPLSCDIYFNRQVLCHSLDGNLVELLTVTDTETDNQVSESPKPQKVFDFFLGYKRRFVIAFEISNRESVNKNTVLSD